MGDLEGVPAMAWPSHAGWRHLRRAIVKKKIIFFLSVLFKLVRIHLKIFKIYINKENSIVFGIMGVAGEEAVGISC